MKMREEVDALTGDRPQPVGVLIFPRLLALVIALPLPDDHRQFRRARRRGIVVTWIYSGITPEIFLDRLQAGDRRLDDLSACLIKAPFMALIIGIIASVEGLQGRRQRRIARPHVTASVVKAIFVVIILDGLFAMFYAASISKRRHGAIARSSEAGADEGYRPVGARTSPSPSASHVVLTISRSRHLSRRNPRLRRRVRHRQIGADAHHPRPDPKRGPARSSCSASI
jgi:hypothetical protein